MITALDRSQERNRIHKRIRRKISGSAGRPRLCVFRSLNHMYAQIVDDSKGGEGKGTGNLASAKAVGKAIAERARAQGIESVVFDRGGYIYHGRVKALADAARESGLKF